MPVLNTNAADDMETHKGVGGFQFSAAKISNLGASEFTLFGLAVDRSGSLHGFDAELERCLKAVIESCQRSPRADNLLARVIAFNDRASEVHGFKSLADCHPSLYDGSTATGGGTALNDTVIDLVDSLATYGKQLISQDYAANGIVVVVTDGMDEHSTFRDPKYVKDAFARAMQGESLESLASVLVGVNVQNARVSDYLKTFKDSAGFAQYVEAKDASPQTLAKLAGFISKSVSSQSQKVGTGSASQPINVTF